MQRGIQTGDLTEQEKLFVSMADGINHTLLQLWQLSQFASSQPAKKQSNHWQTAQDVAQASMQLLEGYAMTLRLHGGVSQPALEAVAVSSLLYDIAHLLEPYAGQFNVKLELDIPASLEPIVSDRAILQSALINLGQVFIAAQSENETKQTVRIGAHKGRYGIVTGMYGQGIEMTAGALLRARKLRGMAYQPFGELVSGSASGLFIADNLLHSLSSRLHVARYHKVNGLAVTLQFANNCSWSKDACIANRTR